MFRRLVLTTTLIVLMAATAVWADQVCITVPAAKVTAIADAAALYNTRTGQSLTPKAWVKAVVRRAVVDEKVLAQRQQSRAALEAKLDEAKALRDSAATALRQLGETENSGW